MEITRRPSGSEFVTVVRSAVGEHAPEAPRTFARRGLLRAGLAGLAAAAAAPVATAQAAHGTGVQGPLEFGGPYTSYVTRGEMDGGGDIDYVLALSHNQEWDPSRGGWVTVDPAKHWSRLSVESFWYGTSEYNLDIKHPDHPGRRPFGVVARYDGTDAGLDIGGSPYAAGASGARLGGSTHSGGSIPLRVLEREGTSSNENVMRSNRQNGTARWVMKANVPRQHFALDGRDAGGFGVSGILKFAGTFSGPIMQVESTGIGCRVITTKPLPADSHDSFQLDVDGTHRWGPGISPADVTLARTAVGVLRSNGKLTAVKGLGVGNSALATGLGPMLRKIEVFDAAGNSLGFVPVHADSGSPT